MNEHASDHSTVSFQQITKAAQLPHQHRLISDTEGVGRSRIVAERLIALSDSARAHVVVAELSPDGPIGLFTDIAEPEHSVSVSHTVALIKQKYPGRDIQGFAVPQGFVAGIYAHTLDRVSYDETDDDAWQTIDAIFADALDRKASDITFVGARSTCTVEFLIHGFKVVTRHLSAELGERIARALYRSASANAQDRNFNAGLPQETSFERKVAGELVRYRYQHIPTDGDVFDVCLRVLRLSEATAKIDFARLGFLPDQIDVLKRVSTSPKGTVMTVGPTGSGKSTSVKGFVETYDAYHKGRKNIREVSNPVEYVIENVRSTNVVTHGNSTAGEHKQAFIAALRAIVRMNPHAILVGEIREQETAELTIEIGRTGHKVFTSSHADSWVKLYPRLRNWTSRDPSLYTEDFVAAIISQELLPTVCPDCAISLGERDEPAYIEIRSRLFQIDPLRIDAVRTEGRGCPTCDKGVPGVAGRIVVATIYVPSPAVLEELRNERDDAAMVAWARSDVPLAGFTMHDHALEHIFSGRVDPVQAETVLGTLRLRNGGKARLAVVS